MLLQRCCAPHPHPPPNPQLLYTQRRPVFGLPSLPFWSPQRSGLKGSKPSGVRDVLLGLRTRGLSRPLRADSPCLRRPQSLRVMGARTGLTDRWCLHAENPRMRNSLLLFVSWALPWPPPHPLPLPPPAVCSVHSPAQHPRLYDKADQSVFAHVRLRWGRQGTFLSADRETFVLFTGQEIAARGFHRSPLHDRFYACGRALLVKVAFLVLQTSALLGPERLPVTVNPALGQAHGPGRNRPCPRPLQEVTARSAARAVRNPGQGLPRPAGQTAPFLTTWNSTGKTPVQVSRPGLSPDIYTFRTLPPRLSRSATPALRPVGTQTACKPAGISCCPLLSHSLHSDSSNRRQCSRTQSPSPLHWRKCRSGHGQTLGSPSPGKHPAGRRRSHPGLVRCEPQQRPPTHGGLCRYFDMCAKLPLLNLANRSRPARPGSYRSPLSDRHIEAAIDSTIRVVLPIAVQRSIYVHSGVLAHVSGKPGRR